MTIFYLKPVLSVIAFTNLPDLNLIQQDVEDEGDLGAEEEGWGEQEKLLYMEEVGTPWDEEMYSVPGTRRLDHFNLNQEDPRVCESHLNLVLYHFLVLWGPWCKN